MIKIVSIPRINSLNLKGPETTSKFLRNKISFDEIKVTNEDISFDEIKIIEKSKLYFKDKVIFLGGDHSITYPLGLNFMKEYENPYLIVLDAHPDCMPEMREPTHEEYLSALIKKGWKKENICLIGLRKIEPEEKEFLKKNKIKYSLWNEKISNIKKYFEKTLKNKNIYLSIDFDVINPKFFPAVNYIEKDGLSYLKFKKILKLILKKNNVRTIDTVEYVPVKDIKEKSKKIVLKTIKLLNKSF